MIFHQLFKGLGRLALLLTVLLAPWCYGGILPRHQVLFYYGVLVSTFSALVVLWTTYPIFRSKLSLLRLIVILIPLLGAILLGIGQTRSLSAPLLETMSPYVADLREFFFPQDDLVNVKLRNTLLSEEEKQSVPEWGSCMSVYPQATRYFTSLLIMLACVFFSSGLLFETPKAKKFLWLMIAINGLILALFMIMTKINPNILFYEKFWPGAHVGPYVNRNNAAGYLCLCFGAAFTLFVLNISRLGKETKEEDEQEELETSDSDDYADEDREYRETYKRPMRFRARNTFFDIIESFNGILILTLVLCGLIVAATLTTLSRGGSVAIILATLLGCGCILTRKSNLKYWYLLVLVLLAGFFLTSWVGMTDRVITRMGTLVSSAETNQAEVYDIGNRRTIWKNTINQAINQYHWRGSGWGTWDLVELRVNKRTATGTQFVYAENIFVQTFVEGGLPGILLLVLGWGALFGLGVITLRRKNSQTDYAFAVGFLVSSAGLLVASCFDFGIYLMANALLYAVLGGSFVNRWNEKGGSESDDYESRWSKIKSIMRSGSFVVSILLLISLLGLGWFGCREIQLTAKTEKLLEKTRLTEDIEKLSQEELELALTDLSDLAKERPGDAKIHSRLAEIYIMMFRLKTLEILLKSDPERAAGNWFPVTQPMLYSEKICKYLLGNMEVAPKKLRNDPLVKKYLVSAAKELVLARNTTPFMIDSHFMLGTIAPLIDNSSYEDIIYLIYCCADAMCYVYQYKPVVHYKAGLLLYMTGDTTSALSFWRESLIISPIYQKMIWNCVSVRLSMDNTSDVLTELFPEGSWRERISFLSCVSGQRMEEKQFRKELIQSIEESFEATEESKRTVDYYREHISWRRSQNPKEDSSSDYEKAIAVGTNDAKIHYEYGLYLYDKGDLERALSVLTKAMELDTTNVEYQELYKKAEKRIQLRNSNNK